MAPPFSYCRLPDKYYPSTLLEVLKGLRGFCDEMGSAAIERVAEPAGLATCIQQNYPNESISLLIVLFKSLSVWRNKPILLMECITVV